MRVLPYIRKVLEIYAGGNQDHLSKSLLPDPDPYPSPLELAVDALINFTEQQAIAIAQLLAGGRMVGRTVDPQEEESWIEQLERNIKKTGEHWAAIPHLDVSAPSRSDLIDIGIIHLVLDRMESGMDRISRLDLLSLVLPERLQHLQTMFSEAHFNYLLGNRTAVTIMCRALLEEALKDKGPGNVTIDGDRKTLDDRLEEAKINGWLDDERIACARDVVKAGNLAAHDNNRFSRYSDMQIEEILINTRKILEDLYR
jgi:Domain of unknown function (DUF4145)